MLQEKLASMVREILGDDYLSLALPSFTLTEDILRQDAMVACKLVETRGGRERSVEGRGVGLIDALFQGIATSLSPLYPSLDHIHFVDFGLDGDFLPEGTGAHSDAAVGIRLVVENSDGRRFEFTHRSRSISASSAGVVVSCVEHFINAELAVLRVLEWIADAKKRRRQDLVDTYTQRLADLVKNASYQGSIEKHSAD